MSEYIRLLQEMFPGKIYLDEVEVGAIFGVSPLTITDRKYRNTLPFSVCLDFTRFDRHFIMSKTEWRKRYEGNEISGRI